VDKIDKAFKERLLDWLALGILWAVGAAIILPSVTIPSFFMSVVAPVLIVVSILGVLAWAIARTYRRRLFSDESDGEVKNQCAK
jgi:VIT1/CCC1 family predicted Fe2+/Mn2+ transporter